MCPEANHHSGHDGGGHTDNHDHVCTAEWPRSEERHEFWDIESIAKIRMAIKCMVRCGL
jgi:hypothetical protein